MDTRLLTLCTSKHLQLMRNYNSQIGHGAKSHFKLTVTCSLIKLVCHGITFPTKKKISTNYRSHSAIVQHDTNLATVYSQVTVGSCLVEYEYKLLCHLVCDHVLHRMLYTSILSICTTLLQGHTKLFPSSLP